MNDPISYSDQARAMRRVGLEALPAIRVHYANGDTEVLYPSDTEPGGWYYHVHIDNPTHQPELIVHVARGLRIQIPVQSLRSIMVYTKIYGMTPEEEVEWHANNDATCEGHG